jgi:hypothetical protein
MDSNNEGQIELQMRSPAMLTTVWKSEIGSITIAITSKEQYCGKTESHGETECCARKILKK